MCGLDIFVNLQRFVGSSEHVIKLLTASHLRDISFRKSCRTSIEPICNHTSFKPHWCSKLFCVWVFKFISTDTPAEQLCCKYKCHLWLNLLVELYGAIWFKTNIWYWLEHLQLYVLLNPDTESWKSLYCCVLINKTYSLQISIFCFPSFRKL